MKNNNLEVCPVYKTSIVLDGKWTLLIFRELLSKPVVRFNELKKSLGSISPKTLSERLTYLELEGFINRNVFPEIPPRVEYSLTDKGRALSRVFDAMAKYGEEWL